MSYIIATILFILALGGLSNQETARRGNWYGIIGMTIALLATILGVVTHTTTSAGGAGDRRHHRPYARASRADDADARAGCYPAQPGRSGGGGRGFRQLHGSGQLHFAGVELTIHDIETYLGILIGAVTFSGSVIAFGKLSGRIGGSR